MIVARDIQLWRQDPVETEMRCYQDLEPELATSPDVLYIAYPWAAYLNGLKALSRPWIGTARPDIVFTVCQHVRFRELIPVFKSAGIKTVFTPHARIDEPEIEGIQIFGFPHWPALPAPDEIVPAKFDYLYSFIGQDNHPIRWDLAKHCDESGLVKLRHRWHFDADPAEQEKQADEYRDSLLRSEFILCPAGVGPSSLRIWEAILWGRIPVLISDQLRLPEGLGLENCIVRVSEAEIENFPAILKSINEDDKAKFQAAGAKLKKILVEGFSHSITHWIEQKSKLSALTIWSPSSRIDEVPYKFWHLGSSPRQTEKEQIGIALLTTEGYFFDTLAMLRSIRRMGRWTGPVLIIHSDNIPQKYVNLYARENVEFLKVNSKWEKPHYTKLELFLNPSFRERFDLIHFIDSDGVVLRPLSPWLENPLPKGALFAGRRSHQQKTFWELEIESEAKELLMPNYEITEGIATCSFSFHPNRLPDDLLDRFEKAFEFREFFKYWDQGLLNLVFSKESIAQDWNSCWVDKAELVRTQQLDQLSADILWMHTCGNFRLSLDNSPMRFFLERLELDVGLLEGNY